MFSEEIEGRIIELEEDSLSGAAMLCKKALEIFQQIPPDPALYQALAKRVIKAHLNMASLYRLAEELTLSLEHKKLSFKEIKGSYEQKERSLLSVAEELIPEGSKICSLSCSSTLLALLDHLHHLGRNFELLILESRPLCEGAYLAQFLEERGIKARYIADCAANQYLPQCDLVILGADTITSSSFTNKIGSGMLSSLAEKFDIELFLLATTDKFLPEEFERALKEGAANQLIEKSFSHIQISNPLFERVSFTGREKIITEEGVFTPDQLKKLIKPISFPELFSDS